MLVVLPSYVQFFSPSAPGLILDYTDLVFCIFKTVLSIVGLLTLVVFFLGNYMDSFTACGNVLLLTILVLALQAHGSLERDDEV